LIVVALKLARGFDEVWRTRHAGGNGCHPP
jgi:hypothetical protein